MRLIRKDKIVIITYIIVSLICTYILCGMNFSRINSLSFALPNNLTIEGLNIATVFISIFYYVPILLLVLNVANGLIEFFSKQALFLIVRNQEAYAPFFYMFKKKLMLILIALGGRVILHRLLFLNISNSISVLILEMGVHIGIIITVSLIMLIGYLLFRDERVVSIIISLFLISFYGITLFSPRLSEMVLLRMSSVQLLLSNGIFFGLIVVLLYLVKITLNNIDL